VSADIKWDQTTQLFLNGSWVTVDPQDSPGVTMSRGVTSEGAITPATLAFRVEDPTDLYRPSSASSPYYGAVKQYGKAGYATDSVTRFTGEIASAKPDQTDDHREVSGVTVRGMRWVDFSVQGQLRRFGQWSDPIESAMRHQISGYANLAGYWPLEDDSDASTLANLVDDGRNGWFANGVSLAAAAGPGGSDKVLTVPLGGSFGGQVIKMPSNGGWQVSFSFNGVATTTGLPIFQWNTSQGYVWQFIQSTTGYAVTVTDTRGGTTVYTQATTFGTGAEPGKWIKFRVKCTVSGSTVTVETAWRAQDGTTYGFTGTYSGTTGRPTTWRVDGGPNNTGAAYGHTLFLATGTDDLTSFDFDSAFDGYLGEKTLARWQRLIGQAGFGWRRVGFLVDGTPMGRQPIDTLSALATEIVTTEDGLVFDASDDRFITIRGRRNMINQTSKLDLTWPTNVGGLKEVTDDLKFFNDVTVKNRGGGEANSVRLTGALSVASSGRVQTTVNVNVDESQVDLQSLADYYLEKYTVNTPRFSALVVDLDAHPELKTAAASVDIGDVVTVTGRTTDVLYLRVLTIDETGRRNRRIITFTCEPADIWYAGVYDSSAARYAALGHVISGGPFAAGVSPIKVNIAAAGADGLAWTHADGNFDIVCFGEAMTVTAVAAPVAGIQSLTVTRAVNGIAKSLPNGAAVQIRHPSRYAR